VHLVCFIIRIYHGAWSSECEIRILTYNFWIFNLQEYKIHVFINIAIEL